MKMDNAVCFFIDSVAYDYVGTGRAKVSPTPFIDSLRKEGLIATNLYSQGPYTDAATRALFTGRNCLDDFGYFFKINTSPTNHYKVFHDAGYETYDFNYPYYIIGDEIDKSIDHTIYAGGFIYGSEWNGLYAYYCNMIKERELTDDEYLLLRKRLQYMFESWVRYLYKAVNDPDSFAIHNKIFETYDAGKAYDIIVAEHEQFKKDPIAYINDFLAKGENHVLYTLDTSGIETYILPETVDWVKSKYRDFFKQVEKNNFFSNCLHTIPSPKRFLYARKKYKETKDDNYLEFWKRYKESVMQTKNMYNEMGIKGWQNQHSAATLYSRGIEILKERKSDKPFYFFFDVEEPHSNLVFYSYDSNDKIQLEEEFAVLQDYVNKLGGDFRGSLPYLLTLRYSDYQVEKFCKALQKMGLWDSTSIMVVSDHGSSFTYNPIHNRKVNCFDTECYHVPLLIRRPGFESKVIAQNHRSEDIFPTWWSMLGISTPSLCKGQSMLDSTGKDYVLTEYMGPGCPDMLNRRIWFSARDSHYIVAYKVSVKEEFSEGVLAEVYDLTKDPKGYYNINDKVNSKDIAYLLKHIELRYIEIKEGVNSFINSIREEYGYTTE